MVTSRPLAIGLLLAAAGLFSAQQRPATPPTQPADPFAKELQNLTANDFQDRQAALKQLQQLLADQLQQRARIQELLTSLQKDLANQQRALAMVADEEAQAQVTGLLELERGLAGWTAQAMSEPLPRRQALLNWGLSKEALPIVAKLYSTAKRTRLEGIKALAKIPEDSAGANWTLARLINDSDAAIRAAAMAACWNRPADADIVAALWYRALSGPLQFSERRLTAMGEGGPDETLHVEFPDGTPLEFSVDDDSGQFYDSQLAGAVLVRLASPLVADRMKTLLAERVKAGKNLCLADDPDWTLVTHRLVEAYNLKEAIPLLADEALSAETDQMSGDMAGRNFAWSRRTMAIGTLCKLIKQDTEQFGLFRARDSGESRGWIWATDVNPNQPFMQDGDGPPVRSFFAWWKNHHAEYGIKEEPSGAGVPPEPPPRPARGRGRGARPIPTEPGPASAPAPAIAAPPPPIQPAK